MRMSQLNVGTATDVSLKITETDLTSLTATIQAPSGHEEPCLLKRLPNRHIGQFWLHHVHRPIRDQSSAVSTFGLESFRKV